MNSRNLIIASTIVILLILIASIFQVGQIWSVNTAGFIPVSSIAMILAASLIFYFISIKYAVHYMPLSMPLFKTKISRLLLCVAVCILLIGIFYLLRSATYLWGDGYLRILETQSGMKLHFSEPLDKLTQYLMYNTIGQIFYLSAVQTHQIISILGGILFFTFTIYFVRKFSFQRIARLILAGLLLSSAVMQLFFGYVESYCISTPLLLLAIAQSYLEIRDDNLPHKGFLIYLLACLFHMSLLVYWPAFLATILLRYHILKSDTNRRALYIVSAGLISLLILAFILNRLQFDGAFNKNIFEYLLIPLLPNSSGYWLFSPAHLADIANLLVLTAPGALIILLSCLSLKTVKEFSPAQKFLAMLCVCGILFLLLFRTSFGMGRDWDLFSSLSLPLNLFAAILLIDKSAESKKQNLKVLLLPILISMLISFSFIVSNSREQSSVQRYRKITDLTNYGKNLNLENLGEYYLLNNDYENYCMVLRQASAVLKHPRYDFKIGMLYMQQGRLTEALDYFNKAYRIDSTYVPVVNYLGILHGYLSEGDPAKLKFAEQYFLRVIDLDPEYANAWYNLGHVYYNVGEYNLAVKALRQAITHEPDNINAYQNLGYTFEKLDQDDSAQYYFQIASQKKK